MYLSVNYNVKLHTLSHMTQTAFKFTPRQIVRDGKLSRISYIPTAKVSSEFQRNLTTTKIPPQTICIVAIAIGYVIIQDASYIRTYVRS